MTTNNRAALGGPCSSGALRFAKTPESLRAACERRLEERTHSRDDRAVFVLVRDHADDLVVAGTDLEPDSVSPRGLPPSVPVVHLSLAELLFFYGMWSQ